MNGPHPSHVTRISDASSFDEICVNCGAHDQVPGGWGNLVYPCPNPNGFDIDIATHADMPPKRGCSVCGAVEGEQHRPACRRKVRPEGKP